MALVNESVPLLRDQPEEEDAESDEKAHLQYIER